MLSEEYYLADDISVYPKIIQDQILDRHSSYQAPEEPKRVVKEPIEIPMPFIKGDPNVEGPLIVTEDWYVKKKKKKLTAIAREKKDMQIEMMRLLGKRDLLRDRLGKLDPGKKKDSKLIVSINIALKDIDAELSMLQEQSGIKLTELDHGTKFQRRVSMVKKKVGGFFKKVKKFFKRHSDTIMDIASVAIPIAIAIFATTLAGPTGGAVAKAAVAAL